MANKNLARFVDEKGKILYNKYAEYLLDKTHLCSIDGTMYIYNGKIYEPLTWDPACRFAKLINKDFPNTTSYDIAEILRKLQLNMDDHYEVCVTQEPYYRYIACRNGVYDLLTKRFMDFSPKLYLTQIIPWDYNSAAYCAYLDRKFNVIFDDDPMKRLLWEEIMGHCIMAYKIKVHKAFILVGRAGNGKSVMQGLLQKLLGLENYSVAEMKDLSGSGDMFAAVDIHNKLANIADDISDDFIKDASLFKKIVSGGQIRARGLYQSAISFRPYATLLFSANTVPQIKNNDGGVQRRLVILPFSHNFKPTDADYDLDTEEKMFGSYKGVDENVPEGFDEDTHMSYLLNLAIRGAERILTNKDVTMPEASKKAAEEYNEGCNPLIEWCNDYLLDLPGQTFEDAVVGDVYSDYKDDAVRQGMKPVSQKKMSQYIKEQYGLGSKVMYVKGVGLEKGGNKRVFCVED